MGSGFLSIGVSGLNAANIGLMTTGHNISNVSTPGYNRQTIVQGTNIPVLTGAGFEGQGTHVQTIRRVYDQYLYRQVLSAEAGAAEMDSYLAQIKQIDNLLADPSAGLSPGLAQFFKGVQEVAANPASIPGRQSMLSAAQSLVARFHALDMRFEELRSGINSQISDEIANINSYATQIADLNQRIITAQAGSLTQQPNDLLDQRDQLLKELNKEIRVTSLTQGDGSFSVFVGNGQPLVVGTQAYQMKAVAAPDDPERLVVALQGVGGTNLILPESQVSGGKLGGLVAFRSQSLDGAENGLGRVAIALAQTFNDQHRLGMDLTGALGTDFFNIVGPTVLPSTLNTSGAQIVANLTGTAAADLTTSDYRLTYSAANTFTMTRISDGASWSGTGGSPAAALTDLMTNQMPPQGFDLAATAFPPNPNVGETFVIQPTRYGARNISVNVTDPRNIAAAAPIRTSTALANTGTGTISAGTVDAPPPPNANLQNQVVITFNNPASTFDVFDVTAGAFLANNVPYTTGDDISYNGWTLQISGAPATGDSFTVSINNNGVADNRNAMLLGALQVATTMAGGTASYQSAYSQIVSAVGTKTREVETIGEAQQGLVDRATESLQQMSGVNLDEEAANLIRYQQAYQASAKIIEISNRLFDSLLTLGG